MVGACLRPIDPIDVIGRMQTQMQIVGEALDRSLPPHKRPRHDVDDPRGFSLLHAQALR